MYNRDFEVFLLEHVRRESAVYYGIMITFGCCAIACIVMAVAALIIFGTEAIGTSIKLLVLFLPFAGGCLADRSIALGSKEAAEEMVYGLDHPECNVPDDYMDETKAARREACRKLHSIRSLIVAYGILSLTLWAATVLMFFLSGVGTPDFSGMLLIVTLVLVSMALPLTVLTIAYILDLPAARKYREWVERVLKEE